MGTDPCNCHETSEDRRGETSKPAERWIASDAVRTAELPADLQSTLGRFLGREPVETLGEWAAAIRRHTDGGAISVGDLCHTDDETPHWGTLDGERYHFACFYDAIVLAALEDRPVDIHTRSPAGDVIEARAEGTDVRSTSPEDPVVSVGIDETAEPPSGDGPTAEATYAAVCPYVKAFSDREAYERWASEVPAATVAMSMSASVDFAAALAE